MTATAVLTLREAVAVVLVTSTVLVGDKVYHEGEVPRGAVLPYAIIGTWAEPEGTDRYAMQPGREQAGQIKLWGKDSHEAQLAYADARSRLDGVLLTLTGHKTVRCRLGLLSDFRGPPGPNLELGGHCVVTELRTRTVAA